MFAKCSSLAWFYEQTLMGPIQGCDARGVMRRWLVAPSALTAQRYQIRRRISQLWFLDTALLHPVCEVGRRRIVALRDELLGGPVGEQRLDFRTVLVQLAFAGAFRPSDRQTGSPSRAKGFFRPRGDQPRSISAATFPPKKQIKSSPKNGRRQIDDIYTVSIGYRKPYGGFGTFEPLGPITNFRA